MINYVEFDPVVLEKYIFKIHPLFYCFGVFSALNLNWPFISAIYIHFFIWMFVANLPSDFSLEKKFKM